MNFTIESFKNEVALLRDFYLVEEAVYANDNNYLAKDFSKELTFWQNIDKNLEKCDYRNFLIRDANRCPIGKVTAIINHELFRDSVSLGLLGNFEVIDNQEASVLLLSHAESWLESHGVADVLAPIDFNTWFRYRMKLDHFDKCSYLFEPYNPSYYPTLFKFHGYLEDRIYHTKVISDLSQFTLETAQKYEDFVSSSMTIRPIDMKKFDEEMKNLYRITINSFQANYLYTPISFELFKASYLSYKNLIDPFLFAIAEDEGRMVGYLFCISDYFQTMKSKSYKVNIISSLKSMFNKLPQEKLLVKTLAVLPEYRKNGIGTAMMHFTHRNALLKGYTEARHCLFAENNASGNFSHESVEDRHYATFRKNLVRSL